MVVMRSGKLGVHEKPLKSHIHHDVLVLLAYPCPAAPDKIKGNQTSCRCAKFHAQYSDPAPSPRIILPVDGFVKTMMLHLTGNISGVNNRLNKRQQLASTMIAVCAVV